MLAVHDCLICFVLKRMLCYIAVQSAICRLSEDYCQCLAQIKCAVRLTYLSAFRIASQNADLWLLHRCVPLALGGHRRCKPMRLRSRGGWKLRNDTHCSTLYSRFAASAALACNVLVGGSRTTGLLIDLKSVSTTSLLYIV